MTDASKRAGEGGGSSARDPDPDPKEGTPSEVPPPPLSEFVERTPARLALEAALGSGAGFLLGPLLIQGTAGGIPFAIGGAILAPLSLLLTPLAGGIMYRAFRYGIALAVLVTLVVSFAVGADVLPVDELLVIALLVFAVGAVGHGIVAAALDSDPWSTD